MAPMKTMKAMCKPPLIEDIEYVWNKLPTCRRRNTIESPFHSLKRLTIHFGGQWHAYNIIALPDADGIMQDHDFLTLAWKDFRHHLRVAIRRKLMQRPEFKTRFDMLGAQDGINFELTRFLLTSAKSTLSFLERGILRTVLAGAVWTPSRQLAANKITIDQARCVHCGQGCTETLGHRLWHCPAWHNLRCKHRLLDFDHSSAPRCLTRCGIAPCSPVSDVSPLEWATLVKHVQRFMVEVHHAAMNTVAAQRQFAFLTKSRKAPSQGGSHT